MTRKGLLVLFSIVLTITLITGYMITPKEEVVEPDYTYEVVLSNTTLDSKLYTSVSVMESSEIFQQVQIKYKKKYKILGYPLSQKQVFSKYVQLKCPKKRYIGNKLVTHQAYVFVLKGDLLRATDKNTKKTKMFIDNGYLKVYKVPYALAEKNMQMYLIKLYSKRKGVKLK